MAGYEEDGSSREDWKMELNTDVVIIGSGVGGLFSALSLPADKKIVMITKSDLESSDSFLAQEESA